MRRFRSFKNMKHPFFIFILVLLSSIKIEAQTPTDICRVTTSWMSISEKIGGGIYVLGEFRPTISQDITREPYGEFSPTTFQDETLKTFKDDKSGMFVSIKIEYGDFQAAEKGKPTDIKLSISVSDKEQDALRFSEGISSETTYGKRWGGLRVERQVTIGDLIHTFRLGCNDGRKEWQRFFGKKQKVFKKS
jgi:hypothetical protein